MRSAVIVVGSSYGDEGKGLAAACAVRRAEGPVLNILVNGGPQRGHTVDLPDGRRHIFSHFGSGALDGAVSCADEDFMVNPLLFERERDNLAAEFGIRPTLLVHARCRVTTPWDMMLGQMIEENRGARRHGSCGCGIQETRLRFRNTNWALRWGELAGISRERYEACCRRIVREYLPARMESLGMKISPEWRPVLENDGLIEHSWMDLCAMLDHTRVFESWPETAERYRTLVFELGQGLALDEFNMKDFPHLTPSRTTSRVSAERIAALSGETETEILYVTRSYLTRHGAGPLQTECPKERINPDMIDRTNVPNPHQQSLRYGLFDGGAVLARIRADLTNAREVLPGASAGIAVTHLNETEGKLAGDMTLEDFTAGFDRVCLSDRPWDLRLRGA